jgi:hypothetical protein
MHRTANTIRYSFASLVILLLVSFQLTAQIKFNPDTVKAKKFDIGRMWTFEYAPVDYFQKTYGFRPTKEWLDDIRLSTLRFGRGCSAGFVSEDGLILTNHHCVDFSLQAVQKEGENIPRDGFYAKTLADERKVPNLFVSQLALIKDVTNEVVEAINTGKNDKEKIELKNKKIKELEEKYSKESGLVCNITSLYHGGKYSLYGYKRYNDVRAVIFVERIVGLYGGDPDNYTYPRYNSDFAVLRVYDENGKPLKTQNYFKMNTGGPKENEVLFALGYPGTTNRLKTFSQLEYNRDITYRNSTFQNNGLVRIYNEMMKEYPEKAAIYQGAQFGPANSAKRVNGFITYLNDPYLMARKKAFENDLKKLIVKDLVKKKKYSHIWDAISKTRKELAKHAGERAAFARQNNSIYFARAFDVLDLAYNSKLPQDQRPAEQRGPRLDQALANLPETIDSPLERKKLALMIDFIILNLGEKHALVKKYFGGMKGLEAADKLIAQTKFGDKTYVTTLTKTPLEELLKVEDPFIKYYSETRDLRLKYQKESEEILNTETVLEDQLGLAIFEIFGTEIPPDATGTFRITDGVLAGYEYNGTVAPVYTTIHGLYDRYYSHQKKWPWDLPARWVNYDSTFDLSSRNNFIGTFDTVGGSSGSPIINSNAEYIGILHDGNMEGLSNDFIYTTEKNRSLGLSAQSIHEIIKNLFKADRIAKELETGNLIQ